MKSLLPLLLFLFPVLLLAQAVPKVSPSKVSTAIYFDKTPPLKEMVGKPSTVDEFANERNEALENIAPNPFIGKPLPNGKDPLLQSEQGDKVNISRDVNKVFDGILDINSVPDNNGSIGNDYFMQTVNIDYAIFNRQGNVVIPKTSLKTFFSGILGVNDYEFGDPVVIYDDQAARWLVAEFAFEEQIGYKLLIALSQTDDPTLEWYRWTFYAPSPDYPRFGISANSFLIGTNNAAWGGDNIFALDRHAMLAGDPSPKMIQFENPTPLKDGFSVALPVDTDGPFAPNPSAAQFIGISDDAWNGGKDQLWIYDLIVDWATPLAATFQRTQVIDVANFDSDFGVFKTGSIFQPNGNGLIALSEVLMNRVTRRVFETSESLVCLHTVDVDGLNHAGLRWYELMRTAGGEWAVRQSGTYAPDEENRWMGSITQNANHEIAIGYAVASLATHPSIRVCGQSAEENANASGVLDIQEISVLEGAYSQEGSSRWGDYGNIAVDPVDDYTFWYAGTYVLDDSYHKSTKVVAFDFSPGQIFAKFSLSQSIACSMDTVELLDQTTGIATAWEWNISPSTFTFVNGTNANSQNPKIVFNANGSYKIQLIASNAVSADTMIKTNAVDLKETYAKFSASTSKVSAGSNVLFFDESGCSPDSWSWSFPGGIPSSYSGETPPPITYNVIGIYDVSLSVTKNGVSETTIKPNSINVIYCQYCSSSYSDTTQEYISRVTLNDLDHPSGSTNYSDFTNFSALVAPGDIVDLAVEMTINGDYKEYLKVWVDWNEDCIFSKVEEQYYIGNVTGAELGSVETVLGSIKVPGQVSPGTKRMRVTASHYYDEWPCVIGLYGEVEDYSVIIEPNSVKEAARPTIEIVYPNPSVDILTIELDSPKKGEMPVAIVDMKGEIIKMRKVNIVNGYNKIQLNVSLLAPGQYFVTVGDWSGYGFVKN